MATLALGACSDSTSPTHNSGYITSAAAVASPAVLSNLTIDFKKLYPKYLVSTLSSTTVGDTTIEKFTVKPSESRVIQFGKTGHKIVIPANVICDPSTTAYGSTEWRKPCSTATRSIEFTVRTYPGANGRSHADFSPDVRFNPNAPVPVSVYFAETSLLDFSRVIIPFCTSPLQCVDEGAGDLMLTTYAAPHANGGYWIFRALRHFSGYNVTAF